MHPVTIRTRPAAQRARKRAPAPGPVRRTGCHIRHRRQLALAVEKGFLNLAKQVFRQVERLLQAQLLLADGLGEQRVDVLLAAIELARDLRWRHAGAGQGHEFMT